MVSALSESIYFILLEEPLNKNYYDSQDNFNNTIQLRRVSVGSQHHTYLCVSIKVTSYKREAVF